MAKEQILKNPILIGIIVFFIGITGIILAIFMVASQIIPGLTKAEQLSGPVSYREYWCAGEAYTGSYYDVFDMGRMARDFLGMRLRFKRECDPRAAFVLRNSSSLQSWWNGLSSSEKLKFFTNFYLGDFVAEPITHQTFRDQLEKDQQFRNFLDYIAPRPHIPVSFFSPKLPTWQIIQYDQTGISSAQSTVPEDDRYGANFGDQSGGASETSSFDVTEWFVYGEIGGPSLSTRGNTFEDFDNRQKPGF